MSLWVRADNPGTYVNLSRTSHIKVIEYEDSWRGDEECDAFFSVVAYTGNGDKEMLFTATDYETALAAAERLWSAIKDKCDVVYPY